MLCALRDARPGRKRGPIPECSHPDATSGAGLALFCEPREKRILVLSDRPGLFTIIDYGAVDISLASEDRSPLYELSRHLYQDIYLVPEVNLSSWKPLPEFAGWPDVETQTVMEFQSNEWQSVRSPVKK